MIMNGEWVSKGFEEHSRSLFKRTIQG